MKKQSSSFRLYHAAGSETASSSSSFNNKSRRKDKSKASLIDLILICLYVYCFDHLSLSDGYLIYLLYN